MDLLQVCRMKGHGQLGERAAVQLLQALCFLPGLHLPSLHGQHHKELLRTSGLFQAFERLSQHVLVLLVVRDHNDVPHVVLAFRCAVVGDRERAKVLCLTSAKLVLDGEGADDPMGRCSHYPQPHADVEDSCHPEEKRSGPHDANGQERAADDEGEHRQAPSHVRSPSALMDVGFVERVHGLLRCHRDRRLGNKKLEVRSRKVKHPF
mmetsp:Transcript_50240/g.81428  ORF Transcript_50240/g.81428 Transcript_50240/m.81428 type:complete len:207 (-) Transcript_50240:21-641(-)